MSRKQVIDITGPDGNAFCFIGLGKQLAEQFELNWMDIRREMMAGDYENLIKVFDNYFGEYVILVR